MTSRRRETRFANIAVCGRFHFGNYVPYLIEREVVQKFYYSHRYRPRRKSDPSSYVNLWLKEHLLGVHNRLFGWRWRDPLFMAYHDLWESAVIRRWREAPLWHVLLHGTARRIIDRSQREGCVVLGEAVNAHPAHLVRLLEEEDERLGIPRRRHAWSGEKRRQEEVEKVDLLLVASRWLKASFEKHGFPGERIVVLPYGVNLSHFAPKPSEETDPDGFRVLCVGQITPRKGQVDLLEAWKLLRLPKAELILIGALDEAMHPVIDRYRGMFRHIPRVPHRELPEYYRKASVFVLPAIEDGFGLVCLEAMACGLPAIATEQTGAVDAVEAGRDGYVVPIRAPARIAESLELLYRDSELRKALGRRAAEKARRAMGWDQYAEELEGVYRQIMNGRRWKAPAEIEARPEDREPSRRSGKR